MSMDLAYLLARYQNSLRLAAAAACIASRASHRALAAEYAKRIHAWQRIHGAPDLAIAA
ncbi:hypothetical protein [Sphingomonas sp. R1]|uniref:hypothetical protein n=1 Tax=Sphingomonas sp. R1 TaxID=399176 RepID=UPI002224EAF5|nr:hypothetical protein [Sphingomonas sp. R1]UYY77951.1 hypothetical protein OIM94_02760 [Sphingomonas sp. R1]